MVLISDSTPLAGLPPGEYRWRGTVLQVEEERAMVAGEIVYRASQA